jgi:hypothetical protein
MGNTNVINTINAVLKSDQIAAIRQQVKSLIIDDNLLQFIANWYHRPVTINLFT